MVYFVGAGSGAPDLITVRGARLLAGADRIYLRGQPCEPGAAGLCKKGMPLQNSAEMTLEQVIFSIRQAEAQGQTTVRLHTGDPSVYGAIREQMDLLEQEGISYEVVPGVSSFCAAAAALKAEYTLPDISQSIIITRMEGRTPVPEKEKMALMAAHGCHNGDFFKRRTAGAADKRTAVRCLSSGHAGRDCLQSQLAG